MAWNGDPKHPFAGIAEKLKRADENILNLKAEIDAFIQNGEYPIIPEPNSEIWKKALSYHRDKSIPLRFSVLTGEIVHHLRSSLDHIIWHFADEAGRSTGVIEFPVFEVEPTKPKEVERYERKIQGITSANVLALIRDMQPYQVRADVADHTLLIIHNMDRFDKHRELVIVSSSVNVTFPPDRVDLLIKADLCSQNKLPASEDLAFSRALKEHGKPAPGIAFKDFGQRRLYPVINGLAALLKAVDSIVSAFANEV